MHLRQDVSESSRQREIDAEQLGVVDRLERERCLANDKCLQTAWDGRGDDRGLGWSLVWGIGDLSGMRVAN